MCPQWLVYIFAALGEPNKMTESRVDRVFMMPKAADSSALVDKIMLACSPLHLYAHSGAVKPPISERASRG